MALYVTILHRVVCRYLREKSGDYHLFDNADAIFETEDEMNAWIEKKYVHLKTTSIPGVADWLRDESIKFTRYRQDVLVKVNVDPTASDGTKTYYPLPSPIVPGINITEDHALYVLFSSTPTSSLLQNLGKVEDHSK